MCLYIQLPHLFTSESCQNHVKVLHVQFEPADRGQDAILEKNYVPLPENLNASFCHSNAFHKFVSSKLEVSVQICAMLKEARAPGRELA